MTALFAAFMNRASSPITGIGSFICEEITEGNSRKRRTPRWTNYEPLEIIGSGSFGVIRKVRRRSDGQILARKEIDYRKMTEKEKRQLVAEVNILRELRHPNIVRYFERFVDRENSMIYIIMEYCEGGDLAMAIQRCKKESKRIPESTIWAVLTQLLQALDECHNAGAVAGKPPNHPTILHRDIKPDNVFIDNMRNVKLGDFGLSRVIENPESEFAKTYVGTPFYMSPELVNESCYNTKSDIWALGCLIYELCALEPPFQAKTQAALSTKIRQGRINQLPAEYSAELNYMVRQMLTQLKRPGTVEILRGSRVQFLIKERKLKEHEEILKRKEEELKRREAGLDAREAALAEREEALRKTGAGPIHGDSGIAPLVRSTTTSSSSSTVVVEDDSRRVPDKLDYYAPKHVSSNFVSSKERKPLDERRGANSQNVSSNIPHGALGNHRLSNQPNPAPLVSRHSPSYENHSTVPGTISNARHYTEVTRHSNTHISSNRTSGNASLDSQLYTPISANTSAGSVPHTAAAITQTSLPNSVQQVLVSNTARLTTNTGAGAAATNPFRLPAHSQQGLAAHGDGVQYRLSPMDRVPTMGALNREFRRVALSTAPVTHGPLFFDPSGNVVHRTEFGQNHHLIFLTCLSAMTDTAGKLASVLTSLGYQHDVGGVSLHIRRVGKASIAGYSETLTF
ncbi:kinase-like domain-containing protein [Chytridium lagenaria]|nr:kinase-like domain-containing protein [Chytridium lagenaria]